MAANPDKKMYPLPPSGGEWVSTLHWCVCIMDPDDPDLGFTASILSHAIKYDGLSEKQARYADKIIERMIARWTQHAKANPEYVEMFKTAGSA